MVVNVVRLPRDYLGDNCIQNFHLGRYIVGYTVGNLVLRRRVSGAVKRDFRTYIRRYTSPNENFEYGYPHSNALLTFSLQKDGENVLCCAYTSSNASCIKPLASCIYSLVNQWKATLRNDVGFPTVNRRIYCRNFMTLSNQTLRCICKCIRMCNDLVLCCMAAARVLRNIWLQMKFAWLTQGCTCNNLANLHSHLKTALRVGLLH